MKQPALSDLQMETNSDFGELGISIEPLSVLEGLVNEKALVVAERTTANGNVVQRVAENAYNFLGSFAKPKGSSSELFVPLKALEDWYNNSMKKANADPTWLTKQP